MAPQLVADVVMFHTSQGGRAGPALPGWGCPCWPAISQPVAGSDGRLQPPRSDPTAAPVMYDGFPLLGDAPLLPGQALRLVFVFLSPDAPEQLRRAGRFYLWEGAFVGVATVAPDCLPA